jgi:hypothetical protein
LWPQQIKRTDGIFLAFGFFTTTGNFTKAGKNDTERGQCNRLGSKVKINGVFFEVVGCLPRLIK